VLFLRDRRRGLNLRGNPGDRRCLTHRVFDWRQIHPLGRSFLQPMFSRWALLCDMFETAVGWTVKWTVSAHARREDSMDAIDGIDYRDGELSLLKTVK